jgi:hypothetical protein
MFHTFKNGLVWFGFVFKYQSSFENRREKKTVSKSKPSPLNLGCLPLPGPAIYLFLSL